MSKSWSAIRVTPCDPSTWDLDLDAIAAAITERTRVVLVNTPNDPTGKIHPAETLQRLADVLAAAPSRTGRAPFVVSDEARSKVLFGGNRMITPAAWYDRSPLVHTYSKSTLAPGQRLGFLAIPPAMPEREELRRDAFVAGRATANTLPDPVMRYTLADLESDVRISLTGTDAMFDRGPPILARRARR